jgi:DNA topoisomerase-1
MGYILFLIESPGKVEKLTHVLGSKYKVMATLGHIMDLNPSKMSIDFKHDFEPTYIELPDKADVIDKIRKAAKKADDVLFAADEDREGEMIAWSAAKILGISKPKRVTYNSVTKDEILKAVEHPRKLDEALVDAQKSRRILDRIVGYELSPLLLKILKINHLSAGRVQSVVARLIVDREAEIKAFFGKETPAVFKFSGEFETKEKFDSILYHAGGEIKKDKQDDEDEMNDEDDVKDSKKGIVKITKYDKAKELMDKFKKATFSIGNITEKMTSRSSAPPFTTSTLQQEASRKMGFDIKRTMSTAQRLYEEGFITYMRTDSTNLSKEALDSIGTYIDNTYGKEYRNTTQYTAKSKNTQEAHEAIRPTDVTVVDNLQGKKIGNDEIRLYSLIWKRAVASQMANAKIKHVIIQINISTMDKYVFVSEIETIVFPGFLKVYNVVNIEEDTENKTTTMLSKLPKTGDSVNMINIVSKQTYQKPPSHYNEASLINKLDPKNLNIGRPATYGPIILKIHERGYVKKGDVDGVEKQAITMTLNDSRKLSESTDTIVIGKETGKIIPTPLGIRVTNFLVEKFPEIMDYKFTSHMEEKLDDIASGTLKWVPVMKEFYEGFHPLVESVKVNEKDMVKKNSRVLGTHPTTEEEIIATIARFGPVVKMKKDKKFVYAPINDPLTLDTITLEDAVKLLEYPKLVGQYEGKDILLKTNKGSYYLSYNKENINIGDQTDITLDKAIEAIKERNAKFLWTGVSSSADGKKTYIYKVINGPYGLYVNVSGVGKPSNIKLPADANIKELTVEKIKQLIDEGYAKKKTYRKRKFTKKTV